MHCHTNWYTASRAVCVCVFAFVLYVCVYKTDFVWQHWFEAAAEVAEFVSVLVDLYSFSIILDLRVHPVGTFLHGVLNGFTCLCLKS